MTHPLKLDKTDFPYPFTRIKATPWGERDQPLAEDLINILTPLGAEKTQKGIKNQTAQIARSKSIAC